LEENSSKYSFDTSADDMEAIALRAAADAQRSISQSGFQISRKPDFMPTIDPTLNTPVDAVSKDQSTTQLENRE
jgi:hypothetical protein